VILVASLEILVELVQRIFHGALLIGRDDIHDRRALISTISA
jgi:hypothetical protein